MDKRGSTEATRATSSPNDVTADAEVASALVFLFSLSFLPYIGVGVHSEGNGVGSERGRALRALASLSLFLSVCIVQCEPPPLSTCTSFSSLSFSLLCSFTRSSELNPGLVHCPPFD